MSYGILYDVIKDGDNEKYNFLHRCNTNNGSSGSPVLNEKNKVIGIHKEAYVYYNFKGDTFINYPIKEFIEKNYDYTKNVDKNKNNKTKLAEFNKKYRKKGINIKNTEMIIIDLTDKGIRNEGLNDLCQIEFPKLTTLLLCGIKISNIQYLVNAEFNKLEIIRLNQNKIKDISSLEHVNFPELEELNLGSNQISDITPLSRVNFPKLKKLYLDYNEISNISMMDQFKFEQLKELKFAKNNIENIKIFEKVNFNELYYLNLGRNKIKDINVFSNVSFKGLKSLYLDNNEISDINELVNFEKLDKLYLNGNKNIDKEKNEKILKYFENKKIDGKTIDFHPPKIN